MNLGISNVNIVFSNEAKSILEDAEKIAVKYSNSLIDTESLLMALLLSGKINALLSQSCDTIKILSWIEKSLRARQSYSKVVPVTAGSLISVCNSANTEANSSKSSEVEPEHLLLGILRNPTLAAGVILNFYGVDYASIKKTITANKIKVTPTIQSSVDSKAPSSQPSSNDSCGNDCCCSKDDSKSNIFSSLADRFKDIINEIQEKTNDSAASLNSLIDKAAERAQWYGILDEAFDMAEATGISVPAAFTHICITDSDILKNKISEKEKRNIAEVLNSFVGIKQ